jgi:hypothetical protein
MLALLLALLLLGSDAAAAAPAVCTGKSATLPQSQCQACVDLYDDTGGDGWTGDNTPTGDGAGGQRNDPCADCSGGNGGNQCSAIPICYTRPCAGTTVTGMYVYQPRLVCAPPRCEL